MKLNKSQFGWASTIFYWLIIFFLIFSQNIWFIPVVFAWIVTLTVNSVNEVRYIMFTNCSLVAYSYDRASKFNIWKFGRLKPKYLAVIPVKVHEDQIRFKEKTLNADKFLLNDRLIVDEIIENSHWFTRTKIHQQDGCLEVSTNDHKLMMYLKLISSDIKTYELKNYD